MPEERDPEPVPRAVALALLRDPVAVRVHELPHVRDAREPDLHSAVREHLRQEPRTDPRRRVVEAGREDGRFVRFPIAVDVHQPHDPLGLRLELLGVSLGRQVLAVHRHAVRHGPGREVVLEPVHVTADVRDALRVPVGLGDVEAPQRVDGEGHRVRHPGLRGEEAHSESLGEGEARHGLARLWDSSVAAGASP